MVKLFPNRNILTHVALRELKITRHLSAEILLFSSKTANTTSVLSQLLLRNT